MGHSVAHDGKREHSTTHETPLLSNSADLSTVVIVENTADWEFGWGGTSVKT